MGWTNAAFIMVLIQAIFLPTLPASTRAATEEYEGTCDGVECGKGSCRVSPNNMFGFICECEPGWNQLLGFLPCIIPNCTLNYVCHDDSIVEPIPVLSIPNPPDFSLFNPCLWSYCGGGSCVGMSGFRHRCKCRKGFTNLLNASTFPCFRDCAVGADCVNLGFTLSNGSFPTSPTNFDYSGGNRGSYSRKLLPWFFAAIALGIASIWI